MHMQAKGTTDYKSGFTFAFEQLLNVSQQDFACCKTSCQSNPITKPEHSSDNTALTVSQVLHKTFPEHRHC